MDELFLLNKLFLLSSPGMKSDTLLDGQVTKHYELPSLPWMEVAIYVACVPCNPIL